MCGTDGGAADEAATEDEGLSGTATTVPTEVGAATGAATIPFTAFKALTTTDGGGAPAIIDDACGRGAASSIYHKSPSPNPVTTRQELTAIARTQARNLRETGSRGRKLGVGAFQRQEKLNLVVSMLPAVVCGCVASMLITEGVASMLSAVVCDLFDFG